MSFQYPYTCPQIDRAIQSAKSVIESSLSTFAEEISPYAQGSLFENLSAQAARDLYDDLEDIFETVRSTNSSMRDAADDQLTSCENKIQELEAQIAYLEEKCAALEDSRYGS